jgi:Na+:H+ antiporter, NhaC family
MDPGGGREREVRLPSLLAALTPPALLLVLLAAAFALYGDEAMGGPVQVALMMCALVSALIGMRCGFPTEAIAKGAVSSITTAVGSMFILLSVGALIGTWNMSGTIATLTYYGIQILSPTWFYVASVAICAAIALAIGSSWTVAGTLGAALVGISIALGLSPEVAAGAVISGAYFGD